MYIYIYIYIYINVQSNKIKFIYFYLCLESKIMVGDVIWLNLKHLEIVNDDV
jgi:hypothetical protein